MLPSRRYGAWLAPTVIFFAGCATQQAPLQWNAAALAKPGSRVGVVMATVPKPDTEFPGAGCLLCLAVASAANSTLTTHAKTLTVEELAGLRSAVAEAVRNRGSEIRVISEEVNVAELPSNQSPGTNAPRSDFRVLGKKYDVDKLVVLHFTRLGFERQYSAYVPTSDPKGVVRGAAYLVDLKTNLYEWYQPVAVLRGADGAWDEPPKFPGLTNAYYQAIEMAKDEVLKTLKP